MQVKKIQLYVVLMFALFPNYVLASFSLRKTYTLRENQKDIKWLFDRRVFKLDAADTYYLHGSPWKTTNHYREFYTELIVPRNGSKTLGEGLEQVRQWKASKWLWNKELYIE